MDTELAKGQRLTIGLAVDVSGSMEGSIQNSGGGELSRLEGLQRAIDALLAEAQRLTALSAAGTNDQISVFAYVYGLANLPGTTVSDLFLLMRAWEQVASDASVTAHKDGLIRQYESRLAQNERQVAIEVMGSAAVRLLSMSRDEAERTVRRRIEEVIQEKVAQRASGTLLEILQSTPDARSTLTLSELASQWSKLRTGLSAANLFVGGSTPMRECLELVGRRLEQEMASAPETRFVLFIASDGESSDGDPSDVAARIRDRGVKVVSCFVSAADVSSPKALFSEADGRWPEGARTMFNVASSASAQSAEVAHLLKSGWRLQRSARAGRFAAVRAIFSRGVDLPPKLFAQVNHSALLDEFLRVVIAPIYAEHGEQSPAGSSHRYSV